MDSLDALSNLTRIDQLTVGASKGKKSSFLGNVMVRLLPAGALKLFKGQGAEKSHQTGLEVLHKAMNDKETKQALIKEFSKMTPSGLSVWENKIRSAFATAERVATTPVVLETLHEIKETYNLLRSNVGENRLGELADELKGLKDERAFVEQQPEGRSKTVKLMELDHEIQEVNDEISDIFKTQENRLGG